MERQLERLSERAAAVVGLFAAEAAVAIERADLMARMEGLNRMLRVQVEALRVSDQMKTDFVSSVSHELRTPLASIIGYVDVLMDGELGEIGGEQQEFMGIINENARRLLVLINDLLTLSGLESGRMVLRVEPVDMRDLVEQRVRDQLHLADTSDVQLSLGLPSEAVEGQVDTDRFGQVITNLLANAIKFTRRRRPRLRGPRQVARRRGAVGVRHRHRHRRRRPVTAVRALLPGAQRGRPLDPGHRPRPRDLRRASSMPTAARSPSRACSTRARPSPSCFPPTTPPPSLRRLPPMSDPETTTARVLVADDEPHLLRLVKFRLEREGYEVLTAADGEAALQVARDEHPDLCVLDVMMPKRSGFDVLRELRGDDGCAGMKVIMLTARAQDRDVDVGFSLGADDYITKPFSPQELRVRIGAHLSKR